VEATLAKAGQLQNLPWDEEAQLILNDIVANQPILTQISAAKRVRDRAERQARLEGTQRVTKELLHRIQGTLGAGVSS
jgi:chlorophyllide a reductase subunit Z